MATRDGTMDSVRRTYDTVAEEYGRRIASELAHKPFDRARLTEFAGRVGSAGPVWDLGCGPGHVAAFLQGLGLDVLGLDLSLGMLAEARARHPGLRCRIADLCALPDDESRPAAMVAFYSLIHIPSQRIAAVLLEWRRVLLPGGHLLLAVHAGEGMVHRDEWWGHSVSIDTWFFDPAWLRGAVEAAGFVVHALDVRAPYPDVEYPSHRAYLAASLPR